MTKQKPWVSAKTIERKYCEIAEERLRQEELDLG